MEDDRVVEISSREMLKQRCQIQIVRLLENLDAMEDEDIHHATCEMINAMASVKEEDCGRETTSGQTPQD